MLCQAVPMSVPVLPIVVEPELAEPIPAETQDDILLKLADVLVNKKGLLLGTVESMAQKFGVSETTISRTLAALGELVVRSEHATLKGALQYVELMTKSGSIRPRVFCQHVKYDETQLHIRASYPGHDLVDMIGKVHVIQQQWTALLEYTPGWGEPSLLQISGSFSPVIRVTENNTGETIGALLFDVTVMPKEVAVFERKVRAVETDEHGSNLKAEQLIRDRSWEYLHTLCGAHKIHGIASKMWLQFADLHKGVVKTLKVLRSPGGMSKLMDAMNHCIDNVEISSACLSQSAIEYRDRVIQAFGPTLQEKPRSARKVDIYARCLFNGDWQRPALQHRCSNCCRNRAETISKMKSHLPKLMRCLTIKHLLNGANWRQWHSALYPLGFFSLMHSLFPRAFLDAFPLEGSGARDAGEAAIPDEGLANDFRAMAEPIQGETAQDTRAAVEWWQREDAVEQLAILRFTTVPQTVLMGQLLQSMALTWDLHQMARAVVAPRAGVPKQEAIHFGSVISQHTCAP